MNKFVTVLAIFIFLSVGFLFLNKKNADNEVVFWTLQMSDFAPYINGVIKDFELENPDIKIKWVDVPFSEGEKRTLASVLSDNPPDLVNLNPNFSSTLASKGALQEIPLKKVKQFNKEILNSLKSNGKLYLIPWYATSAITIYNNDLIKKSGIPLPTTYSDVLKYAKTFRDGTGGYLIFPNITENDVMLRILNKYNCASAQVVNSSECVQVFEMFKDLYNKNLIPKETVTITLQEALEKYMSGNIAIIGAGANFLNMIKENAPEVYAKTNVAPQIKGKLGQNDFSLMNFVIPLKAKHKKAALEFALFLTNDKNQLELAKQTNILAVNETTLQNDFYKKYEITDLMGKARVISASQLEKLTPVFKAQKNQKEINNIVNIAVQNILLNKGDIQTILNKLSKDWQLLN